MRDDRLLVPCEGGPDGAGWLRVTDPPPLEVAHPEGVYVLDDDGAGGHRYVFVPDGYAGR